MKVAIIWTEVNHHSAVVEMPDDFDTEDREQWGRALEAALELTGTYDATDECRIDGVEVSD